MYDSFGQLIRENNKTLDKTLIYGYDSIGNITSVKTYNYTTEAVSGTPTEETFTYNTTYKDRFRKIGNYSVNYNTDGCPTKGRLIKENYTATSNTSSTTTKEIMYLYDESSIVGIIYTANGTSATYYLDKNIKGDVIGIIDENGTTIVKYGYDSWGNCSILSSTNSTISGANSIRYRSYYLDSETGFYCLGARFYNPKWRRFISPDSTEYLDPETQNGLNLYAYCINNPVMYIDPSGNLVIEWIMLYLYVLMAAAAALLVAGVVITIKALCDWIKSIIDEAGKEADEFVDYVANDLTFEDVADIGEQVIDASFNSSNVKRAYELHGAGGDAKYALFEEYEVKFDWDD